MTFTSLSPLKLVEMLQYRVREKNKTLENHLPNAPRHAKYTPPGIQNE